MQLNDRKIYEFDVSSLLFVVAVMTSETHKYKFVTNPHQRFFNIKMNIIITINIKLMLSYSYLIQCITIK